jgi:hypothetical protein
MVWYSFDALFLPFLRQIVEEEVDEDGVSFCIRLE